MPPIHKPRKRFGQNFLHDRSVIERIVAAVRPHENQHIVEIGPGQGALTRLLAKQTSHLTAIEIDRDLAQTLQADQTLADLRLVNIDFLQFELDTICHGQPCRLVGNLPYNVSSPILFHALTQLDLIQDMHFMLQKEVVDRMAAGPGSKTYGRLSVMLQYQCDVEPLFVVKPGSFFPAPKVDSTVVRLKPKPAEQITACDLEKLSQVVRQAFSVRRKTLSNSLKSLISANQLIAIDIDPIRRAETLSVSEFVAMSHLL